MPAPASIDLRQRLVDAYEAGDGSLRELAEEFRVHFNTAWNWVQRYRATGSVAPRTGTPGPKPKIDAAGKEILREEVRAQPDATLVELAARFKARTGISVSDTTVCDALQAMDLPRKKSRRMRANNTVPTSRSSGRASPSRKR
jgi:transposase